MNKRDERQPALVSADSHVSDYPQFWTGGVDKKYGARLPHVARNAGASGLFGDWFIGDGIFPIPTGGGNVGGYPHEGREKRMHDFDMERDTPKGAVDPHARLEAMDADDVRIEIIYPTYALRLPTMRDAELQRACVLSANRWIAEFCSAAPNRLICAGMISLLDPQHAVEDLHQCLKQGARAIAIASTPPVELSYASTRYERFWAAAAEASVPITLHALPPPETANLSGRRKSTMIENNAMALIEDYHLPNLLYDHPIQTSLAQLILSGVLERHPKLRLVVSEWGTAWWPLFLGNMDWTYTSRREGLGLSLLPSEYATRQIWLTFDKDLGLPAAEVERFADRLMWASDYPHIEASWPESRRIFDERSAGLSDATKKKLASENCLNLFGLSPV